MSESQASPPQLLTFEVDESVYALPIDRVLEVAEVDQVSLVPTLPPAWGGVINWHGDALPLFATPLLLRAEAQSPGDIAVSREALFSEYVLVVSDRPGEQAQLGMPIDRVLGLVEGGPRRATGRELVVERRPVAGRVVTVLDPRLLVARAWEVMECTPA